MTKADKAVYNYILKQYSVVEADYWYNNLGGDGGCEQCEEEWALCEDCERVINNI